ncbi:maleylpyruvate isomerase family mycothiol-dependent enzyme [Streptomyces cinnamoneus]|uniref:maleylpyruvate isomerase family mycothiol-dependent enzyme n=1 Tax=Streptomyces cinnamoneus TaxID=53446 RepID=UPI0037B46488
MDYLPHFHREVRAFEAVARWLAADGSGAPLVPSCPGWSVSDLVAHLGGVQRFVAHLVRERMTDPPDSMADLIARTPAPGTDLSFLGLPEDRAGWPVSFDDAPHRGPLPVGMVDWFTKGAAAMEALWRSTDPKERVWTFGPDQTVAFWLRIQTIEAAVHRWDAENAVGGAQPVDAGLAEDAITHTFEVMAPARRAWTQAPPGSGERFRFRRTDGAGDWSVRFEGDEVRLDTGDGPGADDPDGDSGGAVELAGTASDLMLFLWQRIPADRLDVVKGDRAALDRYFVLVPPV